VVRVVQYAYTGYEEYDSVCVGCVKVHLRHKRTYGQTPWNRIYFMVNCDRLCLQYCLQWINGL